MIDAAHWIGRIECSKYLNLVCIAHDVDNNNVCVLHKEKRMAWSSNKNPLKMKYFEIVVFRSKKPFNLFGMSDIEHVRNKHTHTQMAYMYIESDNNRTYRYVYGVQLNWCSLSLQWSMAIYRIDCITSVAPLTYYRFQMLFYTKPFYNWSIYIPKLHAFQQLFARVCFFFLSFEIIKKAICRQ